MFFLPLPYLLAELLIFTTWVHFYEFWDVVLAYLAPSFVGAVLFMMTGRSLMMSLQTNVVAGKLPDDRILHKGASLLGSLLLLPPLFLTRVVALFLILPVFRHISIFIFKTFIFEKIAKKGFSFVRFSNGTNGPFNFQGGFTAGGPTGTTRGFQRQERDAEVVNVTPLEVTHTKVTENKDSSES